MFEFQVANKNNLLSFNLFFIFFQFFFPFTFVLYFISFSLGIFQKPKVPKSLKKKMLEKTPLTGCIFDPLYIYFKGKMDTCHYLLGDNESHI